MRFVHRLFFAVAVACTALPTLVAAPVPGSSAKAEAPAAAARKALDEVSDFNYQARSLNDVLADIKERTGVTVTLDPVVGNFGITPDQPTVNLELKRAKLRDALKAILAPHNLKAGIVREGLFISNDEGVTAHQLRQSVTVDVVSTPFDKAIAALIADSGANVVIDPRVKAKASASVELKLDDVPLEVAIRLLAEVADLRAVRMSNVLFVTSPERALVLRQDADGPIPPSQPTAGFQTEGVRFFGGIGGINVAPALPVAPPAPPPAPVPDKVEPEKK